MSGEGFRQHGAQCDGCLMLKVIAERDIALEKLAAVEAVCKDWEKHHLNHISGPIRNAIANGLTDIEQTSKFALITPGGSPVGTYNKENVVSPKMSDCTSPLGTVCKDPMCPLHHNGRLIKDD